jgi:WD40 repeat protein
VNPSPNGDRAASIKGEQITVLDLRANTTLAGPLPHDRAVAAAAWSSKGLLASGDEEVIRVWDPITNLTRTVFAPHMNALAWSRDGNTLYASDGRIVQAWPIDLARGASSADVRARLDQLTTAQIIEGRAATPAAYNRRE